MNLPPTMPWPTEAAPEPPETDENLEFVDDRWQPKHPQSPPESHDVEGHEFVDDAWVEKPVSTRSSYVGDNLLTELRVFTRQSKVGFCWSGEHGYQCFPDKPKQVRKPDVSFIQAGRMTKQVWDSGNCPIHPDFAAEIVSPNDPAEVINRKLHEYLNVGVRLIWVVYPKTKTVWVFRTNGTGGWIAGAGELSGEDVIPGFTITLETLFSEA